MSLIEAIHDHQQNLHIEHLEDECKLMEETCVRYRGLRKLIGFIQDGSETTVKISQDDATKDFTIQVGNSQYYNGASFEEALDLAIKDYNEKNS